MQRNVHLYNGLVLEIDKVSFNKDTYDYELEVETNEPERVYPQILALLENMDIKPTPSKRGKLGRFMKHRAKHGKEGVLNW